MKSLDALRPVLAKLNDKQWEKLHYHLKRQDRWKMLFLWEGGRTRWLLTLPPRDLAMAVAEVLEEKV